MALPLVFSVLSVFPHSYYYLYIRLILCYVIIYGKVFKGSSEIDFPSTMRLCVSQQLSWGFWAFYALVWTRFDAVSFCCWMWDKINSCHLYGIDGEICGLNFPGWLWLLPWQLGNVFIKDNIVVFHLRSLLLQNVCTCVQAVVWAYACVWCVHGIHSQVFVRAGATLTKQTCRGRRVTERPHVNLILCLQENPTANRLC